MNPRQLLTQVSRNWHNRNPDYRKRKQLKRLGISVFDSDAAVSLDTGKMSATCILATSSRDRQGDILEVRNLQTGNHRLNPIALLDHGLVYPLPIGKTQDEDGNYTVEVGEDEVTQTTYFSQNSETAEQVYRLIQEGIMGACSIGFRPIEYRVLPADPANGLKSGKHIVRSELLEASWVALPANPDCLTALLESGQIGGKSLAPAIKSILAPYRADNKVWARGVELRKSDEMSSVDEVHGGALRKDEDFDETDDYEEEEGKDEPLGASTLREAHEHIAEVVASLEESLPQLEHPKVKKAIQKMADELKRHCGKVHELFKSEYPDAEKLHDYFDKELEEEDEDEEVYEGKSYKRAVKLLKEVLKELEEEDTLEEEDNLEEDEDQEEDISEEDDAKLKRLERALVRKERILAKFCTR